MKAFLFLSVTLASFVSASAAPPDLPEQERITWQTTPLAKPGDRLVPSGLQVCEVNLSVVSNFLGSLQYLSPVSSC